jgi:hypothetical protein
VLFGLSKINQPKMFIKFLVIMVMIVSVGFTVVVQMRLLKYAEKHPLPESRYTRLFGFVRIRYVNVLYLSSVLVHAFAFIWLTFYYL